MYKKLKLNTISSLVFEIVTIVCGFILPRLIMGAYGSNINGLVNSITQFLGIISFLEFGVGKVVQSALYKPLADGDETQISKIIGSARRFFNRIALIMLAYVLVLLVIYPIISPKQFSWVYSSALLAAMSISSFSQYYFGVVDRLLLTADQKGYIQYFAQTVTLILNTAASVFLISQGFGIHVVKLVTSLIFLLRPIYLSSYVRKYYNIDRKIHYIGEPIKQKWNGLAQHISYVILNDTDTIVLTILGSFSLVSIYSAYNLVVSGVKRLFTSMMNGVESYLGNLWAKKEKHLLATAFDWTEWAIHTSVTLIFGCTGFLIVPFIMVYTKGINDAQYSQPLFAALIVLAHACHCLRLPYNLMIFAAGHYKETQNNYIIATVMNLVISVLCVNAWGLVGVALGTLISMLYQTVWMAFYNSKNLVPRRRRYFVKQMMVDVSTVGLFWVVTIPWKLSASSYLTWALLALKIFVVFTCISIAVNFVAYRDKMAGLYQIVYRKMSKS